MSLDKQSFGMGVAIGAAIASAAGVVIYKRQSKLLLADYDDRLTAEVKSTIDHMRSEGLDPADVIVDDNLEDDDVAFTPDVSSEDAKMAEVSEQVDTDREIPIPQSLVKPPLDELAARNQKVAYHKVLSDAVYAATDAEGPTPEEEPYQDENITVISQDLFLANVSEFEQSSLTYFSDGGVLDAMGGFVDHVPLIGGAEPPFGSQSNDPEVVYLRNKTLKKEFEVLKDPGVSTDFMSPDEKPLEGGDDGDGESLQHSIEALKTHWNGSDRR
jgi:hypothetical protein